MNELFYLEVSIEQFFQAFKHITQVPIYHIFIGLVIADSFIVFFISQYGISFVENWGQIGLPMPDFVRQFFEKINRDKEVIKMEDVKIIVDTPKKEDDI